MRTKSRYSRRVPSTLPEGIYEHLMTRALEADVRASASLQPDIASIDRSDLPASLSRHLAREIERALRDATSEDEQIALAHRILGLITEHAPEVCSSSSELAPPARVLRALYRGAAPDRPTTPLSSSTLLTRARTEPSLGNELAREIASADGVEILSAFITMGGVRAIREELERAARRGSRLRVLTTVFTGTTQVSAVEALALMPGAEVRISYDVRRTRLHAKAWLFRRRTSLHTAYVGSANLTSTALGSGQEWMVKVTNADLPRVIEKFEGTFESLWNDGEFEPYDPRSSEARTRLQQALREETASRAGPNVVTLFTLQPFPFQLEILERLDAERTLHRRHRNLLVAATGTGKTVIAAFDYLRACERSSTRPRLLFLAHRREILDQARTTFRHVLRDGAFGEMLADGDEPARWEHVFATIQSAATRLEERVAPDHYRFVVVDECHHVPARSYRDVLRFLRPEILLGLTATPERSDGQSLLPDFCARVAVELRLWHALDRQLLVPFEYYGIADNTRLDAVRWSRSGYQTGDLSSLYTGNEARVDLIADHLRKRVPDVRAIRGLAFCVSVEHAEFMARELTKRGIPAGVVHGGSTEEARADAPRRLESREINVLCTCDLYNEGVDLPFVETLLLLRPTSSATLFMQQLGRGLRLSPGKTTCLVLDFIGQHRAEFRFDGIYSALTGVPRGKLTQAAKNGFPFLPSGCVLQLDDVSRDAVIASLKRAVANAAVLTRELRELSASGEEITLARFLDETGRDLEDVYDAGGWTAIRNKAGAIEPASSETLDLAKRVRQLVHLDDPSRVEVLREPEKALVRGQTYERRLVMIDYQMSHQGVLREPTEIASWLRSDAVVRDELVQLADVLRERIPLADETCPVADWPLALHHHYQRREILAGVGYIRPGMKKISHQIGVLQLKREKRELLLVTLDKSRGGFSTSTRYRDYAISPSLFHWETQSAVTPGAESGRRYAESATNGWSFHLFVRVNVEAPFAFLGPARLESWSGSGPMSITWRLDHAMPGSLFDRFATLAQG